MARIMDDNVGDAEAKRQAISKRIELELLYGYIGDWIIYVKIINGYYFKFHSLNRVLINIVILFLFYTSPEKINI